MPVKVVRQEKTASAAGTEAGCSEGVESLGPEAVWEGAELPVFPSLRGENNAASHELRDPYLFRDIDGSAYLYYTGSGEQVIGVAAARSQ